jgi:energy-coupling factor transport system permease protein
MAGGAALTTNPLLLALIATVVIAVAVTRREQAPWALTLRFYIWLAVAVAIIRVGFRIVFGAAGGGIGPVALDFPAWHLPALGTVGANGGGDDVGSSGASGAAGVTGGLVLFGPVTWGSLYLGLRDGMRLGCLILAVGAANVLASPKRVLAALPGALRQAGTAVVVALTVFPSLALSVRRVRRAARLRGPAGSKRQAVYRVIFPVLADSLDRSLDLAASLESRGFGVTARPPSDTLQGLRTVVGVIILTALAAGALLVTGGRAAVGWPLLVLALTALAGLMHWLGRDLGTTRLSRPGWRARDWALVVSAAGFALGLALSPILTRSDTLNPGALAWPELPWTALLGLLAAAWPALMTLARRPDVTPPDRSAETAAPAPSKGTVSLVAAQ